MNMQGLGNVTVGTSQVAIRSTKTKESVTFRIQADSSNSGIIYIGLTGVLSDGTNDVNRLKAGEEWIFRYNDRVNEVFAISDTSAQTINVGVTTVL